VDKHIAGIAPAASPCQPAALLRARTDARTAPPQILASDGVWDVMGREEAASRVLDALGEGRGPAAAAEQLVEDCVALAQGAPGGEADNTTAVVIMLR
jgi:serine/threonine protein phosphatase PrpC